MKKSIITISREFGSGGRTIGKLLAEKLNIPLYDKEIIEKICHSTGYSESFVKQYSEYAMTGSKLAYYFLPRDNNGLTQEEYIWFQQIDIMKELSKKGPCIIVGRCADYVFKDDPNAFHVFVFGDEETKAKRIIEEYGKTEIDIHKRMKDKDKRRAISYEYFTSRKWGDKKNYDLILNSSKISLEECVNCIYELTK